MSPEPAVDAGRVIADLRELDRRTGGPEGARRLCWDEGWRAGRGLLTELLDEIGLPCEPDPAGNLRAVLMLDDVHEQGRIGCPSPRAAGRSNSSLPTPWMLREGGPIMSASFAMPRPASPMYPRSAPERGRATAR